MAADKKEKKQTIVIKKITIAAAGGHGGSWKVAFADFMTAMMCFFLVMWLLNQTEPVKKSIAAHFSAPSLIEQNFSAFGAELTLEKLFLDLVNEPLKAFQAFVEPADLTPDMLNLGTKKIVLAQIANELGDIAKNVTIDKDEIRFDIPENYLFEKYDSNPGAQFVSVMEKIKVLTMGLEEANVNLTSSILVEGYPESKHDDLDSIANRRLELVKNQVANSFEHSTNNLRGDISLSQKKWQAGTPAGFMRVQIKPKDALPEGFKPRELRGELGENRADMTVYDNFVKRMSESQKRIKNRH